MKGLGELFTKQLALLNAWEILGSSIIVYGK